MTRKAHSRFCRYCRRELTVQKGREPTRDHVVPQWALRNFIELRRWLGTLPRGANSVSCCLKCNIDKSGMPVAVFLEVRLDPERFAEARRRWSQIGAKLDRTRKGFVPGDPAEMAALRKFVVAEFMKPIPAHFVPGTRAISVSYAVEVPADFVTGR